MTMERLPLHRRLFQGWMAITARFGFVQTLVILASSTSSRSGPIALGARSRGPTTSTSAACARAPAHGATPSRAKPDLERAKLAS